MDNINIDQLVQLTIAFIQAPTVKAAVCLVGVLAIACLVIAKYFLDRNQREKEAYVEALRIKKIQEANLQRMQIDASQGLVENLDTAYQQDYDYHVKMIKAQTYKAVYAKIAPQFYDNVSTIIYREDLTPEQKAALIINLIRKK
jgi:hypothetical protein